MVIGKLGKEEKECVRKNRGKRERERERERVCVGVCVCACVRVGDARERKSE